MHNVRADEPTLPRRPLVCIMLTRKSASDREEVLIESEASFGTGAER